ncbi:LpqN/LpqT family lipoprotein [Mycobacteroides abscessus]|uniref:LpqN/LpqT family lipoprotein n=1 Tax=Mycobacteroides abscessus TaxID=36809 RepID=UPI00092CC76A|nr:LpqN/LpqT family lipoprotein [Mycobacteroides abscessus]SHS91769.1 putative lipoprotein LpqN [Mycobacteroides abscessus subsp. abscessus]SIM92992.1 putative lipoprotein LpqN [Mycobacteroides abscessus subsp. abscessus]SKR12034.1 putative lipoprotein LpqN [Mycobacteroides abscessus subsp. abscessus]SKU54068.1 putative lipoprotein LpqN [Mycobacteroides abscessus subsp. abscessus]
MKSFSLLVALFGAVVAVGAAGCSSPQSPTVASDSPATSSTPSTAATAAGCAASDVHRVMLDTKAAEEPKLALPTPAGWEYTAAMNSPMIRGTVTNIGLRANDFTPNAVVTLEDLTGKVTSAQQGIDAEITGVEQGGMAVQSRTAGTVCGHPSSTITYTLQNRPVTALITAAEDGAKTWAAIVTIQTTDPDNPAYVASKQAILDGFQFTVSGQDQ